MTRASDIAKFLGAPLLGEDLEIHGPRSADMACPGSLVFVKRLSSEITSKVEASGPLLALVTEESLTSLTVARIVTPNPRLDFARVVNHFFLKPRVVSIHPSAVIAPSARLSPGVHVGPLSSIGEDVVIGEDSVIQSGVHIYAGVHIGNRVVIHSGTTIGGDGFGYERDERGAFIKIPHLGGVVIEDEVEIGCNTCIDRGTLKDTVIRSRTKVDNLVHVAHNVVIGEDCAIIAHAMLGGSTSIGPGSWVAPSACIREKITVGASALVGLGAVVVKNVPPGVTVMGSPARDALTYKRQLKAIERLISDESPAAHEGRGIGSHDGE